MLLVDDDETQVAERHRILDERVGADGEMLDDATDTGWASIRGETWQVKTAARVARGEKVRVVAIDGTSPRVAPLGGA